MANGLKLFKGNILAVKKKQQGGEELLNLTFTWLKIYSPHGRT